MEGQDQTILLSLDQADQVPEPRENHPGKDHRNMLINNGWLLYIYIHIYIYIYIWVKYNISLT